MAMKPVIKAEVGPAMPSNLTEPFPQELFRSLGVLGTGLEPRFAALYDALAEILPGGMQVLRPIQNLGLVMLNQFTVGAIGSVYGVKRSKVLAQARNALGKSANISLSTTTRDVGGPPKSGQGRIPFKTIGIRLGGGAFFNEGRVVDQFMATTYPDVKAHVRDFFLRVADAPRGSAFDAELYQPARQAILTAFPEATPLVFDPIPPLPPIEGR